MQYTIRDVPKGVDQKLRQRARQEGKSLNQVAVEALKAATGVGAAPLRHNDLDFIAGTWVEDPEFDRIITQQDQVNPEDWR